MTQAYPLQWPIGQPRTPPEKRVYSQFKTKQEKAQQGLLLEIQRLGGRDPIISTNVPIRRDGLPYADVARRNIPDQGVAVYFSLKGRQQCFACDRWATIGENIHAIAKTIEALRGIDRWGSGDMVERAFSGFTALPPPIVTAPPKPWHEVLGVKPDANLETIDSAWRKRIAETHPDKGGDPVEFQAVQDARKAGHEARNAGG